MMSSDPADQMILAARISVVFAAKTDIERAIVLYHPTGIDDSEETRLVWIEGDRLFFNRGPVRKKARYQAGRSELIVAMQAALLETGTLLLGIKETDHGLQ